MAKIRNWALSLLSGFLICYSPQVLKADQEFACSIVLSVLVRNHAVEIYDDLQSNFSLYQSSQTVEFGEDGWMAGKSYKIELVDEFGFHADGPGIDISLQGQRLVVSQNRGYTASITSATCID